MCMNMYDIKLRDKTYSDGCGLAWPDSLSLLYKYLKTPDVVKAIHAEGMEKSWIECNTAVGANLEQDTSLPSYTVCILSLLRI